MFTYLYPMSGPELDSFRKVFFDWSGLEGSKVLRQTADNEPGNPRRYNI